MSRVELRIGCGDEDWGSITLELDEQRAPLTTANFLRYVDDGFYDGTIFHRVIGHFMAQSGGFVTPERQKTAGLHPPIRNEADNGLLNEPGTIAMARTSDAHSATSQFFINLGDNRFLNHPAHDGWGYCVFGRVTEGQAVLERIRQSPVQHHPLMGEQSLPVHPPVIRSARRCDA
ncbi:MAG TPA: peptidylprolyl isomerase [Phycisphaerae bacterium]|nr:peptidylprolyl isomerase [Phycisphaerae bacterium]